jgi:hypothetical protein
MYDFLVMVYSLHDTDNSGANKTGPTSELSSDVGDDSTSLIKGTEPAGPRALLFKISKLSHHSYFGCLCMDRKMHNSSAGLDGFLCLKMNTEGRRT